MLVSVGDKTGTWLIKNRILDKEGGMFLQGKKRMEDKRKKQCGG